jgi:hypothetical protein
VTPRRRVALALTLVFPFSFDTAAAPANRPAASAQARVTIRQGIAVRAGERLVRGEEALPPRRVERPCRDPKIPAERCSVVLIEMP